MNENIKIKLVEYDSELENAQSVRIKVFQEEQGISKELDFDGRDKESDNIIVYDNDKPIGVARVRYIQEKEKRIAKVERVAVLPEYRGKGIGRKIMEFIHEYLEKNKEIDEIKLEAQEYAKEFYEKIGYEQKGYTFEEVGKPHVEMRKKLR